MNKLEENETKGRTAQWYSKNNAADLYPEYREGAAAPPKDEPYFLETSNNGCEKCGHKRWDIINPTGFALGISYGDYEEAEEICDMLNIAYALGRASNARV